MNKLCNILDDTHLSSEVSLLDDITLFDNINNMMKNMNLNGDDDINDLTDLFNNMKISKNEIIEFANKSNNLSEFCKIILDIINQRYRKRCYQLTFNNISYVY